MKRTFQVVTIASVLVAIGYWLSAAQAQTAPQVLLTWQANNFYPADYQGRALATPGTPISVSAEVLRNNKFLDASKANFTWLLDEKLLTSGVGLKEVVFNVNKAPGDSHFVRVSINLNNEVFENAIRVPVAKPTLVLDAPYPNALVKAGSKAAIEAVPYFFNISSLQKLIFSWQIGNNDPQDSGSDNELILNTGTAAGAEPITIFGSVRNANDLSEFASDRIRLIVY